MEKENNRRLLYGKVKDFDNGTSLWYVPLPDDEDAFILRRTDTPNETIWVETMEAYTMSTDDPNVLKLFTEKKL